MRIAEVAGVVGLGQAAGGDAGGVDVHRCGSPWGWLAHVLLIGKN